MVPADPIDKGGPAGSNPAQWRLHGMTVFIDITLQVPPAEATVPTERHPCQTFLYDHVPFEVILPISQLYECPARRSVIMPRSRNVFPGITYGQGCIIVAKNPPGSIGRIDLIRTYCR